MSRYGFFSKLDAVGQPAAVTFNNEKQAQEHIKSWDSNNRVSEYSFVRVDENCHPFADIPALKAAGLGDMLGDMPEN